MIVNTITLKCPYCGKDAPWMSNDHVYGRRFGKSYMCYYCKDCDAYVGCHNNTYEALGVMANKELRNWRIKAHDIFDKQWRNKSYFKNRRMAYEFLMRKLNMTKDECHIGKFDVENCKRVIELFTPN